MRPSFLASNISGLIIFTALVLAIANRELLMTNSYNLIMMLLTMGIALAAHAMCHYYEEIYYDYNPLIGKWKVQDEPLKNKK
jgi:hypothetical protein